MNEKKKILSPDGRELTLDEEQKTSRAIERGVEDREYVPVIVKRTDTSFRHPDDTLERAIQEGIEQHERSKLSLFLSAIAAGLILGFAAMCVALVSQLAPQSQNLMVNRVLMALVYPLGFIVCIMSGTQLFTEQTAKALYPVLDQKAELSSLFRLWGIVLAGNFVGTLSSSTLIYFSESVILAKSGFIFLSNHLTHYSFFEVFISAILAGWLMAQGGWLVLSASPGSSQIICIFIVTFIIGLGGLHHSIAGSAEIFTGLFHSPGANILGSLKFLSSAVMGNLVGGSFFVGILNYGHIKKL